MEYGRWFIVFRVFNKMAALILLLCILSWYWCVARICGNLMTDNMAALIDMVYKFVINIQSNLSLAAMVMLICFM